MHCQVVEGGPYEVETKVLLQENKSYQNNAFWYKKPH